jgi:hypothetical protein
MSCGLRATLCLTRVLLCLVDGGGGGLRRLSFCSAAKKEVPDDDRSVDSVDPIREVEGGEDSAESDDDRPPAGKA